MDFTIERLGQPKYISPITIKTGKQYVEDSLRILLNPHIKAGELPKTSLDKQDAFEVSGPRQKIFFQPAQTHAAIVSCGGLCPGINSVVQSLVEHLALRYGVTQITGFRYGYNGFVDKNSPPITLTPELTSDIHRSGGTILGTSRGTPATAKIVDVLVERKIDILFTIGGDGTLRGAYELYKEIKRRGLAIAIVAIPKTIDNDIPFVKKSFGFETAVTEASASVRSAFVEASSLRRGIGLVKLMGRHAGYIAAISSLAAGHVDYCLIPEVPFSFEGEAGLLKLLEQRLRSHNYAVIVVAEGAGQKYFTDDGERDASGNVKLKDVGLLLKSRIEAYFKETQSPVSIKYIDPSYLIRSAPAVPSDQIFCRRLAQAAVHAAMSGKTGLLIGYWHGELTHVPLVALGGKSQAINPKGELWFNVLETTGQPAQI
ncbi:MAG: ATP-dependent 6-phosphofructokinase [Oligoflexales bacterium]|nr:ATP-dependent 6-phosphofructokinase [Oligoflexales bacterium]